jgi:hypothetical protein
MLRALLVKQAEEATKSSSGNQMPQEPPKEVPAKGPKLLDAAKQLPAKPNQTNQTKDLKAKGASKPIAPKIPAKLDGNPISYRSCLIILNRF